MSLLDGLFGATDCGAMGTPLGNAQSMNASQYNQAVLMQQNAYHAAQQRRIQAGPQHSAKQFNPNEHEAFQIPLSQLVTMWRLKFEDRWIRPTEEFPRFDGEFYSVAFDRMSAMHMFEAYQGWVRLKEDA